MTRKRPSRVKPVVERNSDATVIKTGIYQRTIKQAELKTPVTVSVGGTSYEAWLYQTPDELKAQSEAWNAEPKRSFDAVREQAIRFYAEHAVEVVDMNQPPLTTAMQRHDLGQGLRTYQLPDDAPPIARDAGEVLNELHDVATNENPGYQLLAAFRLGRKYERMLVRQLEHRALSGLRKETRNRRNNLARSNAAEAKRDQRVIAIRSELSRQKRNHERQSVRRAIIAVATRTGDSQRTLWNAWAARPK